jgi:HprK-related kinase A
VRLQTYYLRTGPFIVHVETANTRVCEGIELLYDRACFLRDPPFCDFHVGVQSPFLRRWIRPKVEFVFDGAAMFTPSPSAHALPVFEWGLNWAIGVTAQQYLIVHAAVVEYGGRALLLPGPPGSGKSTLCAGLAYRGWRLLSDELALFDTRDGRLAALARPISLKNESIEVIRKFAPGVVISTPAENTLKGTIALARPPADSFARMDESAMPAWIAFPKYTASAGVSMTPRSKAECLLEIAGNALNYSVLGATGFGIAADIVAQSRCFHIEYGDLEEAVATLTAMAGDKS